jgi:DNA-binding NtrC family response regulator
VHAPSDVTNTQEGHDPALGGEEMDISSKHILLIDDRENWLSTTESALRQVGYEVSKAHDFEEAQVILREEGNFFDLIVADQLHAERARDTLYDLIWVEPDRRRRVIVLFVTEPTLQKMREVFRLGVYDCVTKQDDPERMVEIVREALENRASARVTG